MEDSLPIQESTYEALRTLRFYDKQWELTSFKDGGYAEFRENGKLPLSKVIRGIRLRDSALTLVEFPAIQIKKPNRVSVGTMSEDEEKNGDCDTVRLATCEYFTTYESTLNGTTTLHVDDESFGSILLIEGNATIENDGTTLEVNKGDSVFIDANSGDVKITGNCQWIYSRV